MQIQRRRRPHREEEKRGSLKHKRIEQENGFVRIHLYAPEYKLGCWNNASIHIEGRLIIVKYTRIRERKIARPQVIYTFPQQQIG